MLMTNQQAAGVWCPMVRLVNAELNEAGSILVPASAVPMNRITINGGNTPNFPMAASCLGSKCAAWRKKEPTGRHNGFPKVLIAKHDDIRAVTEPPRPEIVPVSWVWHPFDGETNAQWIEPQEEADKRIQGYCGLSGNPDQGDQIDRLIRVIEQLTL